MKFSLKKILAWFFKHEFEYVCTGRCYGQKSKIGRCKHCGITGFVPIKSDFTMLNTRGCDRTKLN